jgi:hypothetical protein
MKQVSQGRHKKSRCPSCRRDLSGYSSAPYEKQVTPRPGDITICLYCGHLLVFADDLTVRNPTDAEMTSLAGNREVLRMQRLRGDFVKEHKDKFK